MGEETSILARTSWALGEEMAIVFIMIPNITRSDMGPCHDIAPITAIIPAKTRGTYHPEKIFLSLL
jgi:hypothetical protein